jgi:uncharacterized membrane protein SpoIIM required for sporulation
MEYTRFVALRRPLWDEFEQWMASARRDTDRLRHGELELLAVRYRQVLHDHALAGARYPRTAAAHRLGRLALAGTHLLHRDPARGAPSLRRFLGRTFPRAFRRQLPHLAVAVALFWFTGLFGFATAMVRPGLGAALLGHDTIRDLERGRLWTESLVTTVPPAVSSSGIATNNMAVALTGWAGGALAGLGSLWVLALNGWHLGSVLGVTWRYSMADELLRFVAAHGPLELTLIVVCAAGGLRLGSALVAAQDRPRREALAEAGPEALAVLGGCLPWFLVLGVVEALVSPAPAVPAALKVAVGLALEGAFLALALRPAGSTP